MSLTATPDDVEAVRALLGREPQGDFAVVVRDDDGAPRVIKNAPILADGTPMPTLYWLVANHDRVLVGRLESTQAVKRVQTIIDPEAIAAAHARYAAERDALIDPAHSGARPSGGVGGTRQGVKCLHAHFAYFLAGGDDPVGAWVADQITEPEGETLTRTPPQGGLRP